MPAVEKLPGYKLLESDVRELIRQGGIDPLSEQESAIRLIDEAITRYEARMVKGTLPFLDDFQQLRKILIDTICGFGALQKYFDDDQVEEIWINSPHEIFIARQGESELTGLSLNEDQIRYLVERMLKQTGRRLDLSTPFVDASLPDGSRLHVAIPDITRKYWSVNIRKFIARARRLNDLVKLGSMSPDAARFLHASAASGLNILVSGATANYPKTKVIKLLRF